MFQDWAAFWNEYGVRFLQACLEFKFLKSTDDNPGDNHAIRYCGVHLNTNSYTKVSFKTRVVKIGSF